MSKEKESYISADDKVFNPDELPNLYPEISTMDVTSLTDRLTRTVYVPSTRFRMDGRDYVYRPSMTCSDPYTYIDADEHSWKEIQDRIKKEVIGTVNVKNKLSHDKREHIVFCDDEKDLSVERILKTLSAIKGKLMLDIAPIHVQKIQCVMTPEIRKNIVTASKKLKMYGKKRPIIARFDEYGNRLPDELELDSTGGVLLKIVEPEDYGVFYLEMKAIEFATIDYTMKTDEFDRIPF